VDAWRQGFRLGNKMLLKFERSESSEAGQGEGAAAAKEGGGSKTAARKSAAKKEKAEEKAEQGSIRLLVRLDFSDHEKLSHQRWLDRIPAEEPFKSVHSQTFRTGEAEFQNTAELFDSLD